MDDTLLNELHLHIFIMCRICCLHSN